MNIYDWMNKATKAEREVVAAEARTSVGYLWQLSGSHRTPSKKLAERLEEATRKHTPDRVIGKVSALFGADTAA